MKHFSLCWSLPACAAIGAAFVVPAGLSRKHGDTIRPSERDSPVGLLDRSAPTGPAVDIHAAPTSAHKKRAESSRHGQRLDLTRRAMPGPSLFQHSPSPQFQPPHRAPQRQGGARPTQRGLRPPDEAAAATDNRHVPAQTLLGEAKSKALGAFK